MEEKDFGCTQYRLNHAKGYAKEIEKLTTILEFVWQNSDNFTDNIDVESYIEGCKREIKDLTDNFLEYIN